MTKIFNTIDEWRLFRQTEFFENKTLGLAPTMGNLHAGHKSLLARSVQENDLTVLTIFVNPTQFDNADDLKKYPHTLEQDLQMANDMGVDFVLVPEYKTLYPDDYHYRVVENELSQQLCGKHRPGHFDGVLTVVLKLLQLAKANKAYFGEKDFQQLQLVIGMAKAFFLDTEIVACSIVRDVNGLALSSRNSRLTAEQYKLALQFPKLLNSGLAPPAVIASLQQLGFVVDYVEDYAGRRLGAVKVGEVRLIDNVPLRASLLI